MRIRPATIEDAGAIAALHAASWRGAYADILSPEYLAGPIEADRLAVWSARCEAPQPNQAIFVAQEEDGGLIGFVCIFAGDDPAFGAKVDNLHVLARGRGMGLGARLLRHAARWAADRDAATGLYLTVFEANLPARGFYARLGGVEADTAASGMPSAETAPAIRVVWPSAAALAG
jgi:GNAT superfamily N-acetyltransferase